jgi:hypothetical protein
MNANPARGKPITVLGVDGVVRAPELLARWRAAGGRIGSRGDPCRRSRSRRSLHRERITNPRAYAVRRLIRIIIPISDETAFDVF